MRVAPLSVCLLACGHPSPHAAPPHPEVVATAPPPDAAIIDAPIAAVATPDAEVADPPTPPDPSLGLWWLPRRPLPARPTLADVMCVDDRGGLRLDVIPDPDAPTATTIDATTTKVCARGTCRDVSHAADAFDATPDTDGTFLVTELEQRAFVYRVADGKQLYRLKNPYPKGDPDEFSCQVSGFLGPAILALGHDCGGPIALPWLLDAATGRPIARVRLADDKETFLMDGFLHVVHLDATRWAVAQIEDDTCLAIILDARTGAVSERLACTPKPTRVIGRKRVPFTPVACPPRPRAD